MLEPVVRRELDDSWSIIEDGLSSDDSGGITISDTPIAEHNSGAELYVDRVRENPPVWGISISQPVTYNNICATPVTISEQIQNKQYVAKFIRDVCNGIADKSNELEAVAFVPHSGSVESIDLSYTTDGDTSIDPTELPELVDIFCVFPATLPGVIDVDDVQSVRESLVKMVYGEFDSDELPETIRELSSTNEAYGDVRLETYTVPTSGLEHINTSSAETDE